MTFNETEVTATCCKLDSTPVSVVCGRGYSCAALCFSEDASLCPSDNCDSCEDLEEKPQRNGRSYVTRPSSKLSHCTRNGCKVRGRFKACCFHPRCAKRRQTQCSWLNYLVGKFELPVWKRLTRTKNSGHKCTRPGDIPNGRWACEEQEIPIPETADLNGDLETYPGTMELKMFLFIFFSLLFSTTGTYITLSVHLMTKRQLFVMILTKMNLLEHKHYEFKLIKNDFMPSICFQKFQVLVGGPWDNSFSCAPSSL